MKKTPKTSVVLDVADTATLSGRIRRLAQELLYADEVLATFRSQFEKNPAWALDGCDEVFAVAARRSIYTSVKKRLEQAVEAKEDEATVLAELRDKVTKEALEGARWPKRSTSVSATYFQTMQTAIYAELIDSQSGILA